MIKNLFEDMGKYLPAQVIPAIMGLIAIPIITRLFPPEDYGNYVLVLATVSVFSIIVGWLSMSIIRFYPAYKRDSRLDEFYGTTIKLTGISIIVLSLIFMIILFLSKNHISANLYYLMRIGLFVFISTSCFNILQGFLRAKRRAGWYTRFSIWISVTTLVFGIALIMIFHYGVEGLLWGSILSMVIVLPLLWRIAVEKSPTTKDISIPLASKMAKYGFPLVVGNLAAWILSLSDRYIVEFFQGSQEVGIYSVSYNISAHSIGLIASLFLLASWPIEISIWENKGEKAAQEFLSNLSRYYLIICFPLTVGLSVLAKPVIDVLATQKYYEGYKIVPLVVTGAFFLGLQRRFQSGIAYHKKTYYIMFCTVISGLLNLGLNLILVPKYGYMAAAVTTLISYVFLLLLMVIVSRRFFIWEFPFKSLGKVACASTTMGTVVYCVGNSLTSSTLANLILGVCIGILIYLGMLFLLREFKPSELRALLDLKVKI